VPSQVIGQRQLLCFADSAIAIFRKLFETPVADGCCDLFDDGVARLGYVDLKANFLDDFSSIG
jgi:hypothetical protein